MTATQSLTVGGSARIVEEERRRTRSRVRRTAAKRLLLTVVVVAVLLVAWQVAADLFLTRLGVASSPLAILRSLIDDSDLYLTAALTTGWVAVRGWVFGNLVAVVVAVLFVQIPFLESLFLRLALVLFCLPLVAVNPILQLTFPADTARVVLGAIFGEFIGATRGIGVLLINGLMALNLDRIWSIAVIATIMAAVPYMLFALLRDKLAPWGSTISSANPLGRRSPSRLGRLLLPAAWAIGSVIVVLGAWWLYLIVFDVAPFVGKSPVDVFTYLTSADAAAEHREAIAGALGITMLHAGVGYVAGLTVGVTAAVLFVQFPVVERIVAPIAIAFRTVPIIVIIPVLILSLGRGLGAVVAITAIVTFFPTLANTQNGLARVPVDGFSVMRSYDASRWTTLWRLQLPYTLPAIFASARIAVPSALLAATLAEWLATGDGLGHYIVASRAQSDYTGLWTGAAVLTVVSLAVYGIVSAVERRVLAKYSPTHVA